MVGNPQFDPFSLLLKKKAARSVLCIKELIVRGQDEMARANPNSRI